MSDIATDVEPGRFEHGAVALAIALSLAGVASFFTVGAVVTFAAIGFVVVVWRLARFLTPRL